MPFSFNCRCEKNKINLVHEPTPIELSHEMDEVLKRLLWYVPNINSTQSFQSELLNNRLYEVFLFNFVCKKMEIDVVEDVLFNPNHTFMNSFLNIENTDLCINCQKVLLNQYRNETKITSLLRHLRNMIAHGDFLMIDDFFVGRDTATDRQGNQYVSAFVKMYPEKLLKGLRQVNSPVFKEELIAYGFNKVGYTVKIQQLISSYMFDLILEKNNIKFYIEIKDFKRTPGRESIQTIIKRFQFINDGFCVLICDKIHIPTNLQNMLKSEKIILVGISEIEFLFSGRDILRTYI
ncbi:hypothetical protein LG291_23350 [Cytobacillus firmus]|uniref:hypothetical protein n=1 Tax=Cytobacillus firmus TaxID=1399 RepID=UPI00384E1904